MKTLFTLCLATVGVLSLCQCDSVDYDDDDDDDRNYRRGGTTTTTTEETTLSTPLRAPLSTTVETQTIRSY